MQKQGYSPNVRFESRDTYPRTIKIRKMTKPTTARIGKIAAFQSSVDPLGPCLSMWFAAGHSFTIMMVRKIATRIFDHIGMFHTPDKKQAMPGGMACVTRESAFRSVIAREGGQQVQQCDEQVVDIQVQAYCRSDIVGFTTIDDAAGVKQDQATHQHDNGAGDRKL